MTETPTPGTPAPSAKNAAKTAKETSKPIQAAADKTSETTYEWTEAAADAASSTAETLGESLQTAAEGGFKAVDEAAAALQATSEPVVETASGSVKSAAEAMPPPKTAAPPVESAGVETGVGGFEVLTNAWTRTFALADQGAELMKTSSRQIQAMSDASGALAKGAQDASHAWLELTQKTMRTNIEAIGKLARARSLPDLIVAQSDLVRDSLAQAVAAGEEIVRVSSTALREANRAIQPAA
jgi:phasin family protein